MKKVSNILGVLMVIFVIIDLTLLISGSSFSLFFYNPFNFRCVFISTKYNWEKKKTLFPEVSLFLIISRFHCFLYFLYGGFGLIILHK